MTEKVHLVDVSS